MREPARPSEKSEAFTRREIIESVEHVPMAQPEKHLSAIRAILDLTNVRHARDIGTNGPSVAAGANPETMGQNLYNEFYLRDAHVVARFLASTHPALTKATIIGSATYTGVRQHLRADGPQDEQELGKVPHEIRIGDTPDEQRLSAEKDRAYPYYGAIDTTSKNILAIARTAEMDPQFLTQSYAGLDGETHTFEDALRAHTNWLRGRMDLNPEGLLESLWINKKHHANQSWADSPDAFHHADGSWARHHPERNWGVASLEVQAETYDALLAASETYQRLEVAASGQRAAFLHQERTELATRATKLRDSVLTHFWVEPGQYEHGYLGRGTDRDEQGRLFPLAIRTSDMGNVLASRLLDGDEPDIAAKRESVIRTLFTPEMLAPNGLRTLASDSLRYREDAYHNGSSWPWTSYLTAIGLDKHGYHGLANDLKHRVWSFYDTTKTLAEYGTGSADPGKRINAGTQITVFDPSLHPEPIYHFSRHKIAQPPQEVQAWTAAAILAMKYEHGTRTFHPERALPCIATDPAKRQLEQELLE